VKVNKIKIFIFSLEFDKNKILIFSLGLLIHYGLKHYDYHDTYCIYEQIEEFNELINEKLPLIVINIWSFELP
jgi:hypothetical protein